MGCVLLLGILFLAFYVETEQIKNKKKRDILWAKLIISFVLMAAFVILTGWFLLQYVPREDQLTNGIINLA